MDRRRFLHSLSATAALPLVPALPQEDDDAVPLARRLARAEGTGSFWAEVRAQFLLRPGLVHLNAATIGATPRPVVGALCDALWEIESDPQRHVFGAPSRRMDDVRAAAAAFLGAGVDEVALTGNTTEGMNAVAQGIRLGPGDEILTTDHEHPGGSVCWEHVARRTGAEIVRIPMPRTVERGDQVLDLVEAHLTPRTRVCSFSHVSTVTGLVMPMARIAELTRPRGILLVCDGAQAPGMLDVNVRALGVDTYASSSHKWILAPKGSGLLYIRREVQDRVRPLLLHSGFAAYTASSGTRNVATILAHGAALDFHETIGKGRVEARCRELRRYLRERLETVEGVTILTPRDESLAGGILTVSLLRGNARAIRGTLARERNVTLKAGKAEYNALRFSTHIFNDEDDVDRAVEALEHVM